LGQKAVNDTLGFIEAGQREELYSSFAYPDFSELACPAVYMTPPQ
jgi:hypothetical protein